MLAPSSLPKEYEDWNRKYNAPSGAPLWVRAGGSKPARAVARILRNGFRPGHPATYPQWLMRRVGPFAFQLNSMTRRFEYPWCFQAAELRSGMKAVEIGAGASGFQFILAECGLSVVAVDPLVNPSQTVDWVFTEKDYERINGVFGGRVRFIRDYLQDAHLEGNSYDRVFAISVLEHVPEENVASIVAEVRRILKPGGLFVATIDLFLDCAPFSDCPSNRWGRNISVKRLIDASGLTLRRGNRSQLLGHPEFSPGEISKNRDGFLLVQDSVGGAQVMTQCLVLEKPRSSQTR